MNKFRASYTILSTWASGDWQTAIKYYFKLDTITSKAMETGREMHKTWEEYIKANKSLPIEFGGKKLVNPEVENKLVVSIEDWLDLVGKIDCLDGNRLYEFKSGKTTSESYANSKQVGTYGVLATLAKKYVDIAEIHHYDQTIKKHDMSIVYLTDNLLKDTLNWIVTLSSEMHNYLLENKLYEIYAPKKRN